MRERASPLLFKVKEPGTGRLLNASDARSIDCGRNPTHLPVLTVFLNMSDRHLRPIGNEDADDAAAANQLGEHLHRQILSNETAAQFLLLFSSWSRRGN